MMVDQNQRHQAADEIDRLTAELAEAKRHIQTLHDNDPDDMAADGVTVLDVWRKDTANLLSASPSPPAPEGIPDEFQPGVFYNDDFRLLTEIMLADTVIVWCPWGPYKGHAVDCGYDTDGKLVGMRIWDDVHTRDALEQSRSPAPDASPAPPPGWEYFYGSLRRSREPATPRTEVGEIVALIHARATLFDHDGSPEDKLVAYHLRRLAEAIEAGVHRKGGDDV